MATRRTFYPGQRDFLDRLNDLANVGMPRLLADPLDADSGGVFITADRELVFDDNGGVADVQNSVNLTFDPSTMQEGWSVFINVRAGTATVNVGSAGGAYQDGLTSKTIAANNGAIVSFDGVAFRIFRFATN